MNSISKNNFLSKSEYSVIYSGMGGVDFSGDGSNISRKRFSYLENMYRDYEGDGAGIIESIPGYRKIADFGASCNGLYSYKNESGDEIIVAHILNKLYEFKKNDIDSIENYTVTSGINHQKSTSFVFGDAIYILDGFKIFKLSSSYRGEISDTDGGIYIPTTHINGIEAEQRNLLTRLFYEKYVIGSCESVSYGSRGLKYVITNEEKKYCKVTGIDNELETQLCIPSKTKIGDEYYTVTEIGASAFAKNTVIKECIIANGVSEIGAMAFSDCTSLTSVIFSDSVYKLGDAVFSGCSVLNALHLGLGLSDLGLNTVSTCYELKCITYAGSQTDFALVKNTNSLGSITVSYNVSNNSAVIGIPINNPCIGIENVKLDGQDIAYKTITQDGLCSMLKISLDDRADAEGKTLIFQGILTSLPQYYELRWDGFIKSVHSTANCDVNEIISKCRVAAIFDGRVFLSGNPYYPGYVFYSSFDKNGESNPLYFGELNYFRDGAGNINVISMLRTSDSLAVFKEADDGAGSIFYHTPWSANSDIMPKIYPVSYTHHGFCAKGASISFFDDPIFISEKGISAFEKQAINLERSIVTRSNNINPKFLTEDIASAKLAVWRGYLVVAVGGNIYLADSRDIFTGKEGNPEYEWYFLSGIGTYKDDETVYRYASFAHEGYTVHEKCDTIANGEVISAYNGEEYIYYVTDNGINYEVYPTEEKTKGSFYPATHILSVGDLLFFSTSKGCIYVFNNDKRGIAPPSVTDSSDYDADDYTSAFGRRIHHYYYSFAGHAPRYAVKTAKDNCGIPHLLKNTVKHSLTLKCRAVASGHIRCEVGTEKDGYSEICTFPNRDLSFADMDFSSLCLTTSDIYTIPISEKAKGWVEKQITLYTDEYASPFGIYTIAYRFAIKGKIKKCR